MNLLPARRKVGRTVALLALVGAGFVTGLACRDADVHADVRRGTAPAAFNSGAQRSEAHLAAISETLKKIDERLARLEKLAARNLAPDTPGTEARRR